MFELKTPLELEEILGSQNLAEKMTKDELSALGNQVYDDFEMDRRTRLDWESRMEKASKIALQVVEKKTFPWPGASNVKFPLVTIACLQYHARAYPALVDTPDLVHCLPVGADRIPGLKEASERIAEHMSWQLIEEDECWEEETDRLLFVQSLMGSAFKKVYFDPIYKHNVSQLVLPQDFVVSYYTRSITDCPRATHILSWSRNTMVEMQRKGLVLDVELTKPETMPMPFGALDTLRDESQGLTVAMEDSSQPYTVLEQHLTLDLDGDGYEEPYVVLLRYDTKQVLRVLPRFLPSGVDKAEDGQILCIKPEQYFQDYPFIPSPDGGFYGLGFGHLLGPLNESIDTAINQLFDAGTMHNAGGGFLGRGARVKSGTISFSPNEWIRVDATGDDLRKSIVPLPVREPSGVLFNLLGLLIDYGQRVAGAPDIIQGQNPGQNTPAETSRTMMEQGIKVFSGIYKRAYRSLKKEYRLLYRLNQLYLDESQDYVSPKTGLPMKVLAQDYLLPVSTVRPAADPNYMSDAQKLNQATAVLQAAHSSPGYDLYQVNRNYLQALKISNIDAVLPPPGSPNAPKPAPDIKLQIEQMKLQAKQMEMEMNMRVKVMELMQEAQVNQAKISELEAKAAAEIAEAQTAGADAQLALINSAIGAAKLEQEGRKANITMLTDMLKMVSDHKIEDKKIEAAKVREAGPSTSAGETKE